MSHEDQNGTPWIYRYSIQQFGTGFVFWGFSGSVWAVMFKGRWGPGMLYPVVPPFARKSIELEIDEHFRGFARVVARAEIGARLAGRKP